MSQEPPHGPQRHPQHAWSQQLLLLLLQHHIHNHNSSFLALPQSQELLEALQQPPHHHSQHRTSTATFPITFICISTTATAKISTALLFGFTPLVVGDAFVLYLCCCSDLNYFRNK
jgi:hypothetical protein